MLKNFWWALEFSERVTVKPVRITALGMELVAWRKPDGTAVVMSDLCVHRGGALSDGWVENDCIVCPYHGWRYQADGACNRIPAHPQQGIPPKARVDAYPTAERYGMVWAFLGDLPEAERPPMPDLPYHGDPDFKSLTGEFRWNAHYDRVMENALDIAHAPFVHDGAFGDMNRPEVDDFVVDDDGEWGAGATVTLRPPPAKGLWKRGRRDGRPGVRTSTGFYMPNVTRLEVDLPIGKMVLYDFNVPVDDFTTVTKWVQLRSFFKGNWADGNSRKRVMKIFLQDQKVVESQRPELLPFDIADELHVRSDRIQIAYRRVRQKALERGWGIDTHRVRSAYSRHEATVIPSPARREIPELSHAWVRKEVPVLSPEHTA